MFILVLTLAVAFGIAIPSAVRHDRQLAAEQAAEAEAVR